MESRVHLAEWDPFRQSHEDSTLLKYRDEDGWGGKRPEKKPGDGYVISGTVLGLIAGGAAGYYVNYFMVFIGIVAGGVIGALVGSATTWLIRRHGKDR